MVESAFSNNPLKENNWEFYYLMILDEHDEIILMSFFSNGIFKDDMLSPVNVSNQIEKTRITDPYYLCSNTFTMGSLFTEGEHLYFNREHSQSKPALKSMIDWANEKQTTLNANVLMMRDFERNDDMLSNAFHNESFFKLDMPFSNVLDVSKYTNIDMLIADLSTKNKKNYKQEVQKYSSNFKVEFKTNLDESEIDEMYNLYLNVANRNKALNMFPYPKKLISEISKNPYWETMCLYIVTPEGNELAAGCFIHFSENSYNPLFLGINYDIGTDLKVYKQLLFHLANRAIMLKKKKVLLGLSADTDKRKIGAIQIGKSVYISTKDSYNLEILNNTFAN
jgi:hypothetical protein